MRTEAEAGDKEYRANPFAAQCEHGFVKLVEGAWNRFSSMNSVPSRMPRTTTRSTLHRPHSVRWYDAPNGVLRKAARVFSASALSFLSGAACGGFRQGNRASPFWEEPLPNGFVL